MSTLQFNLQDRSFFDRNFAVAKSGLMPPVKIQLLDNVTPVALTGTAATFTMTDEFGTKKVNAQPATIIDSTNGIIEYDWQAGDTDTAGTYYGQFSVFPPSTNVHCEAVSAIHAAGTLYALNELLTVVGGTAVTATVLKVTGVNSVTGAITSVSILTPGEYSVAPTGHLTVTGSAHGINATFDLTYGVGNYLIPDGIKQNLIIRID